MKTKQFVISPAILQATLHHPEANNFLNFLKGKCNPEQISKAVKDYYIGTNAKWPGASIFWQVALNKEIRTGKIVQHDLLTGEVIRKPYNRIAWVHDNYKSFGYKVMNCLYGEHLLATHLNDKIGLVETEKSAIVASIFIPEMVCIAVGESLNLNEQFCNPLKSKSILVYPDVDRYESWCRKIDYLSKSISMKIDPLMQRDHIFCNKYQHGSIADFLFENKTIKR